MLKRDYDEEEDEEEGEGWLASYSDLITDLLAVFVILFSLALLTQGTPGTSASETLSVLDGGTGIIEYSTGDGDSTATDDPNMTDGDADADPAHADYDDSKTDKLIKELKIQIAEAGMEGKISVTKQGENKINLRMVDSILFDTGKATIKSEVKPALENIAHILKEYEDLINYVHIEGHTDNRPIKSSQFPSNWELSTGRAGSVVRFIIDGSGMEPSKFSAAGYGEFRPIADNSTEMGKALNRRVEFLIELNKAELEE